ncbi:MAG: hypothetical protein KA886_04415 [Candidatus Cloacimonetes bacterium]|nr:hypothetical protein [Candidatus Cloacimonadota bacterium]
MQFPKKAPNKNEMSVEEYQKMISENPKMIPKKSMLQPGKSKTMRSLVSEDMLQKATNDLIELKRWWFIRFENWFMYWMRQQEPKYQKHFFGQVAGKMPDNLIMVELGHGMFLGVKLELKTEDAKGRAVGKLHGKQKNHAEKEGWYIARNTKQVEAILEEIETVSEKVRRALNETTINIFTNT